MRFVSLQFTDIMGIVKNVHIPFHKFEDAVDHGLWFDGSSIEGFARIHESDMFLDPDLETFGIIPWERRRQRARPPKSSATCYTPGRRVASPATRAASCGARSAAPRTKASAT